MMKRNETVDRYRHYHSRHFLVSNLERLKELKQQVSGLSVEDLVNQCVTIGLEEIERKVNGNPYRDAGEVRIPEGVDLPFGVEDGMAGMDELEIGGNSENQTNAG